jgi:hypothetical protein
MRLAGHDRALTRIHRLAARALGAPAARRIGHRGIGGGSSQKPARQSVEQHEVPVVHVVPIGLHAGAPPPPPSAALTGGAWDASHAPLVQLDVQQSAPVVQAP